MYLFKNSFWLRSQRKLAENASKSLHSLFTIFNKFDFTIKKKCDLFDFLVLPVMHYAYEIWSYSSGTDVEVIHNKFCRKVLCVKKSTYLSSVYGELGRVLLSIIRKCDMIRYWLRILKLPQNSVVRLVYNMLKKDAD